jgi:hypothetical protein
MPSIRHTTINHTLTAAVANGATVTVAFPTGSVQADLANAGSYVIVNDNDRYVHGAGVTVAVGASNVVITNGTGATWPIGTRLRCQFSSTAANPAPAPVYGGAPATPPTGNPALSTT